MKKIICVMAVLTMLFSLAACGSKDSASKGDASAAQQTTASSTEAEKPASSVQESSELKADDTAVPGVLYQLNLKEGEEPAIKGLALDGNVAGSGEDGEINGRALSAENIRSVFEQNEWISFRLDTALTSGLYVVLVPHEADPAVYSESYAAKISEDAVRLDLHVPESSDDVNASWGDVYLPKDTSMPGYYDAVFVSGSVPVARIMIKLCPEQELAGQTNEALQQMMDKDISDAKERK